MVFQLFFSMPCKIEVLNDGIKDLLKSGDIKRIYESYGIEWQK